MERIGIPALTRAIEILGGQTPTADVVGVKQPSLNHILHRGRRVPAEWCIPLEDATKGAITCADLRPDIYPTGRISLRTPIKPKAGVSA